MEIYLVGGAVRDALMGLPVADRDWVVVGASVDAMLAKGFIPVGKDFPVFLHPRTHEEYALARTERKSAPGYRGFVVHAAPDVTLEDDLARRDITINSIAAPACYTGVSGTFNGEIEALEPDFSRLVDPFGGKQDVAAKVLRHVTDAFREDPVRILRVARFAARFADFSVAPETLQLMRQMVESGEADHLVGERVWQEMAKGLMTHKPSRLLEVLNDCGAFKRLFPPCEWVANSKLPLERSAELNAPLPVRFALLNYLTTKQLGSDHNLSVDSMASVLRVPSACRELAVLLARERTHIDASLTCNAESLLQLLVRCDALRRPERFADLLLACECAHAGLFAQRDFLLAVLQQAQTVATDLIAVTASSTGLSGQNIGEMVNAARVAAVASYLAGLAPPSFTNQQTRANAP
jgi:tRNA nucleotidyltransferase (CCA-adding enzyme)